MSLWTALRIAYSRVQTVLTLGMRRRVLRVLHYTLYVPVLPLFLSA
jgi:hypothetical protein